MKRVALLLAAPLCLGASEPTLVPDVSQRRIDIAYSFTGTKLLVFGAIGYPRGRVPDGQTDVAVTLKGPTQALMVREKRKLAGLIWANSGAMAFRSAPGFYAVASSRPLEQLVDERTAAIYELGLADVHLSPATGSEAAEVRRFENGLVDLRRKLGLYASTAGTVEIREGVLYRAELDVPARVPVGAYVAQTFLIRDGRVLAVAESEVEIRKSGFESFVSRAAVQWPVLYGLTAVALSLLLGWAGGFVLRRR